MLNFIKKILGISTPSRTAISEDRRSESAPAGLNFHSSAAPANNNQAYSTQDEETTDDYFEIMGKMQQAVSERKYDMAARLARKNMRQVLSLVRSTKRSYSSFDISSIPVLEVGGTVLALLRDEEGLAEMVRIVKSSRDLEPWVPIVEQHDEDRKLFVSIMEAVRVNPGCEQAEVKGLVGVQDGRRISNLIAWLEKAGKISREKRGKTYAIWLAGAAQAPKASPKRSVHSHRIDRKPSRLFDIDVTRIEYVPLPRSPMRWEEAAIKAEKTPELTDYFEARETDGWKIVSIEKIPADEKPDTAFRQFHSLDSGLLLVDDLGKAEGLGQIPAAAILYGRTGQLVAKKPLLHDIYRINVNPMGRGLIALSKDCVAHAYNDSLNLIFETPLTDAPEMQALRKRLAIPDNQLKNHIRCVALSHDGSRYLFSAVDEAWCVGIEGSACWGVKLPIKDGWSRIAEPGNKTGTSVEIGQALSLMNMSYPFSMEDIKKRYRELAKEWHPDLHPADITATERMQELNGAMQLLTGIDGKSLPTYTGVQYSREISRSEINAGGMKFTITASYTVSEIEAADWIYAASFAGRSNKVFLAGYSGRIVVLTESGEPVRCYDIGSVPRSIADTDDYLYILTDTRLYVLHDGTLYAIIDTFDSGDLIVAQTGFGLLEKKRFRWFREDGKYLGSIVSKDPIRRVYPSQGGMTVESRTRRAVVHGAPTWWEEGTSSQL